MPPTDRFRPGAFAVLRLAGAPVAAAAPTRNAPDPATATAAELCEYLAGLYADETLREAIELSSPSLAAAVGKLLAVTPGESDRGKLERAVLASTRYLLRMTGRPTPFGLLAGVAPVRFGASAKVRIGADHTRVVHPDSGWLYEERRTELPERVVANNLVEVRGDRVVLQYLRKFTDERPGRQLSIANSPAVRLIRTAARRPIQYGALRDQLLVAHPEATPDHADQILRQLLDREILLPEHAPKAATGTAQVDLRMDVDLQLPQEVADEAARAAEVLWRLSPPGDGLPDLAAYHLEFLDRYGTDRVVPVLELLDPHLGLGPPADYRAPFGERSGRAAPAATHAELRDQILAVALSDNQGELVLDEALIDRLAGTSDDRPPDSLDLCAQLFADSAEAVDRGDFLLSATSGSIAAGAMLGRFATMLGLEDELTELLARPADPLPVQLQFQPFEPRFGNVLREPRLLPHLLAVGTFADPDDPAVVDVRDIAVGTTGERLYLLSTKLGRELSVVRPNMINVVTAAPNAARFLAAVGLAGRRFWTPWQWGRLAVLPRLPRVRTGRTILAPALWRVDPALAESTSEWDAALDRWRDRWQVPDVVRVTVFDHHLDLDLRVPLHRRLFRDQIRKEPSTVISETPAQYGAGLGVTGGHANELVVPIVSTADQEAVAPNPSWTTATAPRIRHLPGGEWLYAKVYLMADLQDAFLAGPVSRLVDRMNVDRWFFLRYADPDAHLRLRFHQGDPAILHDWARDAADAGLIRTMVLDEYEPETVRYGGPEVLAAAEDLFCADSRAVVDQLQQRARGQLQVPIESLTALNQLDLLSGLGDLEQWFVDTYPIDLSNAVPVAERTEFLQFHKDFQTLDCWQQRTAAARAYGAAVEQNRQAVMSVLHLHSNRLLGMDRSAENRAYGLLRVALRRKLDLRRHCR
ncbi:lantibiotic dehydratase [Kribbella sp. NBC_01505]|uniref:lantibiotic dehydratase n=1 Tax=Kribbella sp. NBC_01505 TaxID=2903580 RepID=UPI003866482C